MTLSLFKMDSTIHSLKSLRDILHAYNNIMEAMLNLVNKLNKNNNNDVYELIESSSNTIRSNLYVLHDQLLDELDKKYSEELQAL